MLIQRSILKTVEPLLFNFAKTPLPIKTAIKMKIFLNIMAEALECISKDIENIKNKYSWKLGDNPPNDLIETMNTYLSEKIEIDFEKFKLDEFPDNLLLTPTDAAQLEPFIEI